MGKVDTSLLPWGTTLVIINLATVAWFVFLFFFVKPRFYMFLPSAIELGLHLFVGFVAFTTLVQEQEVTKSFRKSTFAILIASTFRVIEVVCYVCFPLDSLLVMVAPFVLIFWVLFVASRDYFEADLSSPDPINLVPKPRELTEENHQLINANAVPPSWSSLVYHKEGKKIGLMQVEVIFLVILTFVGLLQITCLVVQNFHNFPVLSLVIPLSLWTQIICCTAYVLLKIVYMLTLSLRGVFFSTSHSDGFVWALLLFGALTLLVVVVYEHAGGGIFIFLETNVLAQVIPYTFHLFNVRQRKKFSKDQSQVCDSAARSKLCLYLVVASLHLSTVGYVLEFDTSRSLLTAARAAGLIASLDLCFVALSFMAPIFSFATHLFRFGIITQSANKLYFHRNMAVSAFVFFCLHVVLHGFCWYHKCSGYYSFSNLTFLTGVIMVVSFSGTMMVGFFIKCGWPHGILHSLHIPLAVFGFVTFFMHGNPTSSLCLPIFAFSVGITLLYFVFFRTRTLEIEKFLTSEDYIFMVAKYSDSKYILPGSFFNIYGNQSSHISLFHSHSFPVLSSANSQITFLIPYREHANSFTYKFTQAKLKSIRVQGPFKGPSRSFVLSLRSASFRHARKCVFMVGWKAGFANVFSLLEYFKDAEQSYLYNIHSINCMFLKIDDDEIRPEIHELVGKLVKDWKWETPLSIVEANNEKELFTMTANHVALHGKGMNKAGLKKQFPRNTIWFAVKNKDDGIQNKNIKPLLVEAGEISGSRSSFFSSGSTAKPIDCTMVDKWIYFSGGNFPFNVYKEPKWHVYVESL